MLSRVILCAALTAALCGTPRSFAQGQDTTSQADDHSWKATDGQQGTSGNINPTRSNESHAVTDGRTVDKKSLERLGVEGRYEPYLDTEKEVVRVDASTSRTIERTYGRDPDGQRTLIQVTQQDTRSLPGGAQTMVRTTSNPDLNGSLQVIRREVQETKPVSGGVQDSQTTVFAPDVNGGFSPIIQVQERQTKASDQVTQIRKSTRLSDANGNWQLSEVKETKITDDKTQGQTKEERVLRPDSNGQFSLVERTVSKQAPEAAGEQRGSVETYSADVPGTSPDGELRLNQRITIVHRKQANGNQVSEEQVERRGSGNPGDRPQVTQKTIDIVRPGIDGNTQQQTTESLGSNGSLGVVWVDTRKTTDITPVHVDVAPPSKPK